MAERYDGNDRAFWSECVWMPNHIRNRITVQKIAELNRLAEALLQQGASPTDFTHFEGRPITPMQRRQLHNRGYR